MEIRDRLEFRGQDVSKSKKKHFIGFATPEIVEKSILYLHIGFRGLHDLKCKK